MEYTNVSNVERKVAIRHWIYIAFLFVYGNISGQSLEFKTNDSLNFKYWESLPENYDPSKKYPLIVFLHGRGERGDSTLASSEKVLTWGPLRHVKNGDFTPEKVGGEFIIIAPQLDRPASFWAPSSVDIVMNFALNNYPIDHSRVYLTGLSMGGNGTWSYAYSQFNSPNKLAAIVPIASWGNETKACNIGIRDIPVWAFHGMKDDLVPFDGGKSVFDAAEKCKKNLSTEMIFTSYENTYHNSWQQAYSLSNKLDRPNIFTWMLSKSLSEVPVNNSVNKEKKSLLFKISKLPSSLDENSGMAFDTQSNLYMHNDSGNGTYLFRMNLSGKIENMKKVIFASNFDWEDMAIDKSNNT
ncbi:hypothetical protein E1176_02905, partial [Fulvivirga sp. RKSG066]|uniref:hypothetical protein n=1 Tax=Fulvivirga aurantia TaxID=2529383 RepID=UPI0012BD7207